MSGREFSGPARLLAGLGAVVSPRDRGASERNLVLLAEGLIQEQRLGEAERALKQSLHIDPDSFEAVRMITRILRHRGRHDEQVGYYAHLQQFEPTTFAKHMARGSLLYAMRERPEVVSAHEAATGRRIDAATRAERSRRD